MACRLGAPLVGASPSRAFDEASRPCLAGDSHERSPTIRTTPSPVRASRHGSGAVRGPRDRRQRRRAGAEARRATPPVRYFPRDGRGHDVPAQDRQGHPLPLQGRGLYYTIIATPDHRERGLVVRGPVARRSARSPAAWPSIPSMSTSRWAAQSPPRPRPRRCRRGGPPHRQRLGRSSQAEHWTANVSMPDDSGLGRRRQSPRRRGLGRRRHPRGRPRDRQAL
jgi:hypothetical protein